MRIKITEEGKKLFSLWIPERIVLNSFSASLFPLFANRKLKKRGIKLTGRTCRKFVRALYKSKKHFGGKLDIVDVESAGGSKVKITI